MAHLVLIADLVASRRAAHRLDVQRRLQSSLDHLNSVASDVTSPFTLTLGDEFQAVLSSGRGAMRALIDIQAAIHPQLARFSLAVGDIDTDINPRQAIGMDGPAFHQARAGIEQMKGTANLFRVQGVGGAHEDLANASLNLVSAFLTKWRPRRVQILKLLRDGHSASDIAQRLGVSEQAVYKNMSDGRLHDVLAIFDAVGRLLQDALRPS